ncbi:MAG: tRNA (adenosine(37)-N6)-threonylcarbamoyltransferase complex ATPase subunit type 1 TsaE [Desulfosarcinaceae bacterium]|nr:tRNA (adenosine(37)-N6)-threonylcarbamoyltransferase complex ATPase subunit type 1 TsaE [Desulfosarcinaceae bacterium]
MSVAIRQLRFTSDGAADTRRLATAVGRRLADGSLVLLEGELGSGKTVFAQGLADGLAVPETYVVTSPTYTLVNEYPGRLTLYHVDLYRLPTGAADLESLGLADQIGLSGVLVIEWPDRLPPAELPPEHLQVRLVPSAPQTRDIELIAYGLPYVDLIDRLDFFSA